MTAQKQIPSFDFNDNSDLPLWAQLRDRIAYLIDSGFYEPGEKLPTVRKYAADLRIAYNTVSKAYMGLERDGYVKTVHGSGVYVNARSAYEDFAPHIDMIVEQFVKDCVAEGVPYDDIPALVSAAIRKGKSGSEE